MAENDKDNDEYQFSDLDALGPDSDNEVVATDEAEGPTGKPSSEEARAKLIKNAIIAVVVIIVLIIIVKLFSAFFSGKKPETKLASVPQEQAQPAVAVTPPQPPAPIVQQTSQGSVKITQQLTDLESNQQNMQNGISTLNSQLGGINGNLNAVSAKIAELSTIIANLSAKVEEQSREIDQLTIKRTKAVNTVHRIHHKPGMAIKYYIQAVIPGRAWLIATNGNTLTVREGSTVPGYGVIKLIDPNQGCILTSSGRMIKFSQQDS